MILLSIKCGSLPPGTTERLIVFLNKDKVRNILNHWHLITLLNVSYKVFAKDLQMRLQPVLMELISSNQSAFLSMRFILNNIFLTQEMITHARQSYQPLLFLKLDFSKAYDKIDLKFLLMALQRLGFPDSFTKMVSLMFQHCSSCFNQWQVYFFIFDSSRHKASVPTCPILISYCWRNICPLAPYLFLYCWKNIEPQCQEGGSNGQDSRYLAAKQQLIAQFANDTSLLIATEYQYVQATRLTLTVPLILS